jgi:hypothetical protein
MALNQKSSLGGMSTKQVKTVDGSIHRFFAGAETTGKKAVDIAEGINHILTKSLAPPPGHPRNCLG